VPNALDPSAASNLVVGRERHPLDNQLQESPLAGGREKALRV
jgi:hypothetical protein